MIKFARVALIAVACGFLPFSASAAPATKADAESMVQTAADFGAKNGEDKLVAEVNKKDGPFNQGDLYVVIYDKTGTVLAHPVTPALVGKNQVAEPDADGKLFRREIVEVADKQGAGWVNYKAKNPTSGEVQTKTSYVKKQGALIIMAGVYAK